MDELEDFMSRYLGWDNIVRDTVGNLIARYGDSDSSVAFVGHIDTVKGELPVVLSNGFVSGRGAVDAKGPLIAAAVGALMAKETVKNNLSVYLIALVGEEGPSHGAWELVRRGYRFDHAIVLEPTGGDGVVVEYRGSLTALIRCESPGGHTSSGGPSACDKLIDTLGRLRRTLSNSYSVTPTMMKCGDGGGILPKHGEMILNIRVPTGAEFSDVDSGIIGSIAEGCNVFIKNYTPPVKTSVNSLLVRAAFRALISLGIRPHLSRKMGTSDMNILHGYVSKETIAYGPGDPVLAHTDMERVSISELVLASKAYAKIIEEIASLKKGR